MFKGLKRKLLTSILALSTFAGSLFFPGCDEYNKADISRDGTKIAFSLNKEAGFETESSSEMYTLDISKLPEAELQRLTFDSACDAWASFSPEGNSLLFVKIMGKDATEGMSIYLSSGEEPNENIKISEMLSPWYSFPIFISENKIFYSYLTPNAETEEPDIICQILKPINRPHGEEMSLEEIVRIPWKRDERLWSTTPAFSSDGKMYYAVGKKLENLIDMRTEEMSEEQKQHSVFNINLYSVDLDTKEKRDVTEFSFLTNGSPPSPVGMADLAVSSDNKKLICCFLPEGGPNFIERFDDTEPSLVYVVNLEDGKYQEGKRIYMYYPQFAPLPTNNQPIENPEAKESQEKAPQNEEPKYEFVFLSGAAPISNEESPETKEGGRRVYISDLEGNTKELARFPDEVMKGYTGWTWLSEERLRIYHIGTGIFVVDTNKDGTNRELWKLAPEDLVSLKQKTDLRVLNDYMDNSLELVVNGINETTGITVHPRALARDFWGLIEDKDPNLKKRMEEIQNSEIKFSGYEEPQSPEVSPLYKTTESAPQ